MTTETIPCVGDCVAVQDFPPGNMTDNPPDSSASNKVINAPYIALKDIQLDLASFIFGLSELHMRVNGLGDFAVRISLLQNCAENAKSKIDKLIQ